MIKFPEQPTEHICGASCNLEPLVLWSSKGCSFPKTNTPPQTMQVVLKSIQGIFLDCFSLFFSSFLKTRKLTDM